jgi:glutamate 5-kinase
MKAKKDILAHVERVVVKVGSSLTWHPKKGINPVVMSRIVRQIAALRAGGLEVILVSSGAISAGMARMGMRRRPETIPEKQATAAVGQVRLMDLYEAIFSKQGLTAAQVLLTRYDLQSGQRYFNARNTLDALLAMGVVPIINENDTVAVEEIRFGDNDRLAALVTNLVRADLLVILTDVDGLRNKDPRTVKKTRKISIATEVTAAMKRSAGGVGSLVGSGGMLTKVEAAEMVTRNGEHMVVADGMHKDVLRKVMRGDDEGTLFVAQPLDTVKRLRWMPYTERKAVGITVKAAAEKRLRRGGERLYVADVARILGEFEAGWAIRLADSRGKTFAKGICGMSSKDLKKSMAKKASKGERPHTLVRYADIAFKKKI